MLRVRNFRLPSGFLHGMGLVCRLLVVCAVALRPLPAEELRGVVLAKGRPVPGATVSARLGEQRHTAWTDAQGAFRIPDLSEGDWQVEVTMLGFQPSRAAWPGGPLEIEMAVLGAPQLPAPESVPEEALPPSPITEAMPAEEELAERANESFLLLGSVTSDLAVPRAAPAVPPETPVTSAANPAASPAKPKAAARAKPVKRKPVGNKAFKQRDTIRGTAHFSLRNSALDARPYSLSGLLLPKASYAQNRYGFSAGGPLKILHLINQETTQWFVNYNGSRSRNPFDAIATLPTPLERAGDFSQTYLNGPVVIYDNSARAPFPGNKIPPARVDPAARGLLDLYPLPNLPGIVQNWQLLTSAVQNQDTLGFRLSRSLSKKDRLAGNVNWQWRDGNAMQVLGFRDRTQGSSQSLDVTWIRNQKPGFVITTRGTFNRSRNDVLPYFAFGPDYAGRFGIQGTSRDPVNYGPPNLNFTNYATLADGVPVIRKDLNYAFSGNVLRARGRHNFTAGGEWRRIHLDNRTETNPRGSYSFSGLATSGFDLRGQPLPYTGYDFADFLVGRPQSSNIRFGNDMEFRGGAANVFAQDDWRIRSNLTLNLGMRYEYASPFRELQGRMANLDIAPDFAGVAVVTPGGAGTWGGVFPVGLIDPDRNNFAPRLGLAYKPFKRHSTLFRAGYGWYYNETTYSQLALRLAQQPPFAKTNTLTTSTERPLTIATGFTGTSTKAITNTFGVDRSLRIGYAQSWSASLQQDLPFSLVVELGYLATKGTRLDIQRQPNRAAPGSPLTAEDRRRIGNAVGFTWDSSEGNSILHSGQLRVTRRFKRGLSVNFNYVYGKTIDNASTFGGGGATFAQNDRDLTSERGLSSFDRRHTMNLNWVFTTVSGRRGSKTSLLYRDWTFAGGFQLRSGGPMTARVLGNRADSGGTGVVGAGRAEATGDSISSGAGLFNLDAFTLPPSTRFGNAGRNTIPLPAFSAVNLSLARTFRLGDGKRGFDFRVESNNLLNQVSLTRLATTVNALNYGLPLNAAPMRTVQGMLRFRF